MRAHVSPDAQRGRRRRRRGVRGRVARARFARGLARRPHRSAAATSTRMCSPTCSPASTEPHEDRRSAVRHCRLARRRGRPHTRARPGEALWRTRQFGDVRRAHARLFRRLSSPTIGAPRATSCCAWKASSTPSSPTAACSRLRPGMSYHVADGAEAASFLHSQVGAKTLCRRLMVRRRTKSRPIPRDSTSTAIHAYLTRSYWSPGIPLDIVERAMRNSLCFGVYECRAARRWVSRAWSRTTPRSPIYATSTCSRSTAAAAGQADDARVHGASRPHRRAPRDARDARCARSVRAVRIRRAGRAAILMEVVRPDIYRS